MVPRRLSGPCSCSLERLKGHGGNGGGLCFLRGRRKDPSGALKGSYPWHLTQETRRGHAHRQGIYLQRPARPAGGIPTQPSFHSFLLSVVAQRCQRGDRGTQMVWVQAALAPADTHTPVHMNEHTGTRHMHRHARTHTIGAAYLGISF